MQRPRAEPLQWRSQAPATGPRQRRGRVALGSGLRAEGLAAARQRRQPGGEAGGAARPPIDVAAAVRLTSTRLQVRARIAIGKTYSEIKRNQKL